MANDSVNAMAAKTAVAITLSNSTTYAPLLDALYVGGAGNISIVDASGTTVLFTAVPAGSILPINCSRVRLTDTTASAIVGLRY